MSLISRLRTIYRKYIHIPILDKIIYAVLDSLTNLYSYFCNFSFPANFIRRWKLDMLWTLYEKETVNILQKYTKPGMVVVDVGAHVGYFTRLFSKWVGDNGTVYAFEADPQNFALLKKNTKKIKNVKIFPLAITDHAGVIDFFHYPDKAGCNSILPNVPLDFRKEKITVNAVELDSVLRDHGVEKVDIIKIDIEGGEPSALRGMQKTLSQPQLMLIVEFAPAWIKAAGETPLVFLQNLKKNGFKIFGIIGDKIIPISTTDENGYLSLIPKTPTAYNEFINLFCIKE